MLTQVDGEGVILGGGVENRIALVAQIEQRFRLFGTPTDQLVKLIQPETLTHLADVVQLAGGSWPQTILFPEPLPKSGNWLIKTLGSSGGLGVRTFGGQSWSKIQSKPTKSFLQRRISGPKISALFLSCGQMSENDPCSNDNPPKNCSLIGCTEQLTGIDWLGAAEFSYCGSIGPIKISNKLLSVFTSIGSAIASEFGLQGFFGIDFIINHSGVWPIDINPRIPASAELFERWTLRKNSDVPPTPMSIIKMQVDSCIGNLALLPKTIRPGTNRWSMGKGILFHRGSKPWLIDSEKHARLLEYIDRAEQNDFQYPTLADIPKLGSVIEPGAPVLTLLTEGPNRDEAKKNLRQLAQYVEDLLS